MPIFRRPVLPWLLALTAAIALAQSTGTTIVGKVAIPDGSPAPGVLVRLTPQAGVATQNVVTDEQGLYRFLNLPPGAYNVEASLEGFKTETQAVQTAVAGATVTLNFQLDLDSEEETVILGLFDAASYRSASEPGGGLQSQAGFATGFAYTGILDPIVFNDALDQEVAGFRVKMTGTNGEVGRADLYYLTPSQFSVRYDTLLPGGSANGISKWTFQLCRDDKCGPGFTVPIRDAIPSPFFINSAGFGDGIVTDRDYAVNSFDNPADLSSDLTLWINGARETDISRIFVGGLEAQTTFFGETNGIKGFSQWNFLADASKLLPGRHLFQACAENPSGRLECSNPAYLFSGSDPSRYSDPTGWGAALSAIYQPGGIAAAEVQMVEQDEYVLGGGVGEILRKRSLVFIDPSLRTFAAPTYHWSPPPGEWDLETRRPAAPSNLAFNGTISVSIQGYVQTTLATATNPDTLAVYTQPTDGRQINGTGRFEWDGSIEGAVARIGIDWSRVRSAGVSDALRTKSEALIRQGPSSGSPLVRQIMETLGEVAQQQGGQAKTYFFRETANAGDLGFASASVLLTAGQLASQDRLDDLIARHRALIESIVESGVPLTHTLTWGYQEPDLFIIPWPVGSPVDYTRVVFRDGVTVTIPENIP